MAPAASGGGTLALADPDVDGSGDTLPSASARMSGVVEEDGFSFWLECSVEVSRGGGDGNLVEGESEAEEVMVVVMVEGADAGGLSGVTVV